MGSTSLTLPCLTLVSYSPTSKASQYPRTFAAPRHGSAPSSASYKPEAEPALRQPCVPIAKRYVGEMKQILTTEGGEDLFLPRPQLTISLIACIAMTSDHALTTTIASVMNRSLTIEPYTTENTVLPGAEV